MRRNAPVSRSTEFAQPRISGVFHPSTGIGGVPLMQYLPLYDAEVIEVLNGLERRLYEALR